jgi:lysozyme family protein
MSDFELAVAKTIANEGCDKYTEILGDKGGATKYGISLRFLLYVFDNKKYDLKIAGDASLFSKRPDRYTVEMITLDQAKFIYKKYFWDANRYGEIEDQEIADKVFDMAVLMGAPQANKIFQKQLDDGSELEFDGIIGCKTLYMINDHHCKQRQTEILGWIIDDYIKHFIFICNKDKSQSKFLLGWLNRVMS